MTTPTKNSNSSFKFLVINSMETFPKNYTGVVYIENAAVMEYYTNGKCHRHGGPARIFDNGTEEWWWNDNLHRIDEPACIYFDGTKEWWRNNLLHRVDGPAVEGPDGVEEYWLFGEKIGDPISFKLLANLIKLKDLE